MAARSAAHLSLPYLSQVLAQRQAKRFGNQRPAPGALDKTAHIISAATAAPREESS